MIEAVNPDGTWQSNTYDASGIRSMIVENGVTTEFMSFNGLVLGGYNKDGEQTEHYYYGNSLLAAEYEDAETSLYYYLKNSHGDVIGLTDISGTLTETYRYDAFGTLASIQGLNENGVLAETETALSRFLYAGEQLDSTTGLYYLRARQYDTVIGRFTQEDTYLGDGRNLYAYVSNNPLKYVDPSGREKTAGYKFYNPDSPQIAMAAEAIVALIPESIKREFTQGAMDNFSPVEMEVSDSEGITFWYAVGWLGAEFVPGEDIVSGIKDAKRFKKSVGVMEEIVENADNMDEALEIIEHTDGKFFETIKKIFKKNDSDVVEEITEEIINGGNSSKPFMNMDLQFFADKGDNIYTPSPKHDPMSGWGSPDIIPDMETGQGLLDAAYSSSKSKQLYNIFEGQLIKFQPDIVFGWHAYSVANPAKEVPVDVLRKMLDDGIITPAQYKDFIKNKMK